MLDQLAQQLIATSNYAATIWGPRDNLELLAWIYVQWASVAGRVTCHLGPKSRVEQRGQSPSVPSSFPPPWKAWGCSKHQQWLSDISILSFTEGNNWFTLYRVSSLFCLGRGVYRKSIEKTTSEFGPMMFRSTPHDCWGTWPSGEPAVQCSRAGLEPHRSLRDLCWL